MTHDDILNINPVDPTDNLDDGTSPEAQRAHGDDNKEKLILVKQTLEKVQNSLNKAFKILEGADTNFAKHSNFFREANKIGKIIEEEGSRIIEGVFDGQNMIGPDAKQYSIPANYASKSKLVEGDILKLTIQPNGTFVYKQINPKDRDRLKGILIKDEETNDFKVLADGKKYKILLASVTYFKGEEGDEVIILTPKEKNSTWAAVENIVKKIQDKDISKIKPNDSESNTPETDSVINNIGI